MGRVATTERSLGRRRTVRIGRPPRELAGEVETRILDAARRVFLERGLAGASMDEIAGLARAGKPTIYARFPSKEALFTAVVMRQSATNIARFESYVPTGASIEERLASLGTAILHWLLVGNTVGLMRLSIAESRAMRWTLLANSETRRDSAIESRIKPTVLPTKSQCRMAVPRLASRSSMLAPVGT